MQQVVIHLVQSDLVYLHSREGLLRHGLGDDAIPFDLRIVAYALEQTVDDTRCATSTAGNLADARWLRTHFQNLRRTDHNLG